MESATQPEKLKKAKRELGRIMTPCGGYGVVRTPRHQPARDVPHFVGEKSDFLGSRFFLRSAKMAVTAAEFVQDIVGASYFFWARVNFQEKKNQIVHMGYREQNRVYFIP
ncbi:MAG TPA: hypothetical protein VHO02_07290 [Fibrobacteria bacterium]|jgi:hypothetical protein|nr:hypothetical protein [Fibrobacteria bacterium]